MKKKMFRAIWRHVRTESGVLMLCAFGLLIRVAYVMSTPVWLRGHDFDGHLEYVRYVAQHWAIPPPHDAAQFYHPPTYYFLAASAVRLAEILSPLSDEAAIQILSVILSFLVIVLCVRIASQLFPGPSRYAERFFFVAVSISFPSLIFLAARVNNDALYTVCAFLAFSLLLSWWAKPTLRSWLYVSLVVAGGLLVKTNMILWIPIASLLLLLTPRWGKAAKVHAGIILGCSLLFFAGWLHLPRIVAESDVRAVVVGNVYTQTGPVSNLPEYFLTFDPYQVFIRPFVGGERVVFFWEYFFHSALFGEFQHHSATLFAAYIVMFCAMASLPFVAVRMWKEIRTVRTSPHAPLFVAAAVLLAGAMLDRIALPFIPSQDFRYSIALIIPWTAWAVRGLSRTSGKTPYVQRAGSITFVVSCAIFVCIVAYFS